MKNLKKIMALVIAMVMIVSTFSMSGVFAEEATNDTTIKISGLEDVNSVNFYQILTWDGGVDKENHTIYAGWKFASPFSRTGLKDANGNAFATDEDAIRYIVGDPGGNPAVDMQLTAEIAGVFADQATSGAKPATLNDAKTEASLAIDGTTNTIGLYMALITTNDASEFLYNPVFVSADYNTAEDGNTNSWIVDSSASYSNSAAAKKSKEHVDKTAEATSTSYDNEWKSTRPGEEVDFTVSTSIPGYGPVYQTPHFVIKDKLTDMTLKSGTVTLSAPSGLTKGTGTADETATDADYFITETTGGYTITFTQKYLKTVNAPTDVTVTYTATVNEDVELNVNEEENEVWIEYSHNPQDESDYAYEKDDTIHYTFSIDANALVGQEDEIGHSGSEIIKVAVDASGNPITSEKVYSWISSTEYQESPLAGATFKLYTDAACTAEYTAVDGSKFDNLSSDSQGRILIEGLDAGTYYLKEEKAPTGYIKDQNPVKIEIIPEYEEIEVTMYTNGTDWVYATDDAYDAAVYKDAATYKMDVLKKVTIKINGEENVVHTFEHEGEKTTTWIPGSSRELPSSIVNTKGVELPSTGGMGTTLFYIIGAVLVLGAGILLVTRRRVNAN